MQATTQPPRGLADRARVAIRAVRDRGAVAYDRETALPRLLPIAAGEIGGSGAAATRRICALLARALRAERTRGRAGHWSYDLGRHLGLLQAYRAERERLRQEQRSAWDRAGRKAPRQPPAATGDAATPTPAPARASTPAPATTPAPAACPSPPLAVAPTRGPATTPAPAARPAAVLAPERGSKAPLITGPLTRPGLEGVAALASPRGRPPA